MKISDIKPYEKNNKLHPPKQVKQVADSIKAFGFNQPIVVDKNGVIIVGHGRFLAAKQLGLADVPTIQVDLNEEQTKAYRLADNKLNESEWDMKLVIGELKELSPEMFSLTGFDQDLLIEPDEREDEVPEIPTEPKSKLGDLYELGAHRLLCGDSTSVEAVSKLMDGKKADMIFTDPPYNVNYNSASNNGYAHGKFAHDGIFNDNIAPDAFYTLLLGAFKNGHDNIKKGAGVYVFHASSSEMQFKKALDEAGFYFKSTIIWNKPAMVLGWGDYQWKHEPCFYCGVKGDETVWYGGYDKTSVWKMPSDDEKALKWLRKQEIAEKEGYTTIWSVKKDATIGYVHPTQKPVELICHALKNSSKAEDIVVDFFGGSGSTMLACQKMNRISHTIELDPVYVDVIVQRYVDYTGCTEVKKNGVIETWTKSQKTKETIKATTT